MTSLPLPAAATDLDMSALGMLSARLSCVPPRLLRSCLPDARAPARAHSAAARLNSNRTAVVRCGRQNYERLYPVLLVHPDGSTVNIRYKEPRRILTMPVDLSALSDEQRRSRLRRREVKTTQVEAEPRYEDNFSADTYRHLWK